MICAASCCMQVLSTGVLPVLFVSESPRIRGAAAKADGPFHAAAETIACQQAPGRHH